MSAPRRKRKVEAHSVAKLAGGVALGWGIAGPKNPGWGWEADPRTSESLQTRAYNLKQSIPLIGKDPNMAAARAAVATGGALIIAAEVAPKIPLVRTLHKIAVKLDRKTKLRLF